MVKEELVCILILKLKAETDRLMYNSCGEYSDRSKNHQIIAVKITPRKITFFI